jgi:hypothetical protein
LGIPLYVFDFAAFVQRQVVPLGCEMLVIRPVRKLNAGTWKRQAKRQTVVRFTSASSSARVTGTS